MDRIPQNPPKSHYPIGIAYTLIAWLFAAIMVALSRPVSLKAGIPAVLFFQNATGLLLVLPWALMHRKEAFKTQHFGLISLRTIVSLIGFSFLILAVQKISLTETMLLNNSAPIFVPFIIWAWKRDPINHRLWPGIIAGFIGIVLILKPGLEILNPGAIYGLITGICLAFGIVCMRALMHTEHEHTVLFYYFLISSILTLPIWLIYWKSFSSQMLLYLLLIGILQYLCQYALLKSLQYAKATYLAPFSYVAIVYSLLIDWLIWHHIPDWIAISGIILVCLGGILTLRVASKASAEKKK